MGVATGELMSSLDDASQNGTTRAMLPRLPALRVPEELRAPLWRRALDLALPSAYAAGACTDARFSTCHSGTRSRTFTACSIGQATLDGSVSLAFSSTPVCALTLPGQSVTRTASFTLTGLYGGTLAVTSPGGGRP